MRFLLAANMQHARSSAFVDKGFRVHPNGLKFWVIDKDNKEVRLTSDFNDFIGYRSIELYLGFNYQECRNFDQEMFDHYVAIGRIVILPDLTIFNELGD